MTTPQEPSMSPIWRKLPPELIHHILTYFLTNLLSSLQSSSIPILYNLNLYSPIHPSTTKESKTQTTPTDLQTYTTFLLRLWQTWRHDPLFTPRHKRLIERHFYCVWLKSMTIYLHVQQEVDEQIEFCRYLPFSPMSEGLQVPNPLVPHLYNHPVRTIHVGSGLRGSDFGDDLHVDEKEDSDDGDEWTTFYLWEPIYTTPHLLEERPTPFDVYEYDEVGLVEAAARAWGLVMEGGERKGKRRVDIGLRPSLSCASPKRGDRGEDMEVGEYTPGNDVVVLPLGMAWMKGGMEGMEGMEGMGLGLEVVDGGRRMRFRWRGVVDGFLGTLRERVEGMVRKEDIGVLGEGVGLSGAVRKISENKR
ncbi:hypothetical protein B0T20DRAFT_506704 [Sordaria brevicollis]|uniref:Uncharacterized protein n=1 Tax=Sordaria brevicollis TaxID=83679 RepID=A0AAE0PGG6_SORBR|nr:hypothetical protein B0T20DRAFT_506704 [Sordaria brevicollis]